jgi:tetratricopeptide (TPR) repeat protein
VQEDFIATGTETLDKLDGYILQCDAVIHLVGDMTGALAQAPSVAVIRQRYPDFDKRLPPLAPFLQTDGPPLSYTQWEAWLALYHGKTLIIAAPQEGAPRDERYVVDEQQRAAQQDHLERLASVERYPEIRFANADRLAVDMLRSRLQEILAAAGVARAPVARAKHNDFPRPLSELIGREREIEGVLEALARSRLVSVEGELGVGKTALLLHVLSRLFDRDDFTGLIWTSARDPSLDLGKMLDEISHALDFPYTPEKRVEEKEALIREELARKAVRCLLVVDNFESAADGSLRSFVGERLPDQCVALVASSVAIVPSTSGLTVIKLKPLAEAAGVRLFEREAARVGVDLPSAAMLRKLCEAVGGLPLAVELAVGQMRAGREPQWIVEEIARGEGVLFSMIADTWRGLSGTVRDVLGAASLFPLTFGEEALRTTSGLDLHSFREAVTNLVLRYLVRRVEINRPEGAGGAEAVAHRYVLHPLMREYVRHWLGEHDPANAMLQRAAGYFTELVREHGGRPERESASDLAIIDQERTNILAIMDACECKDHKSVLVQLMVAAARWFFIDGHWIDLETWGAKAVKAAEVLQDKSAASRIKVEIGRVYGYRLNYRRAEATFKEALALAKEANDRYAMGYIKHHMGEVSIRRGLYAEAEAPLKESLEVFESLNLVHDTIGVRYRLAVLAYERGDADAERRFEDGVRECQEENWDRLEAYHRNYLGDIAMKKKEFPRARLQYHKALELTPPTDSRRLALLEFSMAKLEYLAGDTSQAAVWALKARDHLRKLGIRKEEEEAQMILELCGGGDPHGGLPGGGGR